MKQDDKVKDIQSRLNEAETCAPEKALKICVFHYEDTKSVFTSSNIADEALLPTLPFEEKSAEVVTRYIEIKVRYSSISLLAWL